MRSTIALGLLTVATVIGCSKSEQPQPTAGATKEPAKSESPDASHAAAVSASKFLNALAKGDEQTAVGRLTPLAAQQMAASGKRFAFTAVDSAEFRVTKVWQPQTDEAAVQYQMSAMAEGERVEFELCCFMREVDGDWRLGGIAYDVGDGQQPVVVNYEAADTPAASNPAQTVAAPASGSHMPQTAQSLSEAQVR